MTIWGWEAALLMVNGAQQWELNRLTWFHPVMVPRSVPKSLLHDYHCR